MVDVARGYKGVIVFSRRPSECVKLVGWQAGLQRCLLTYAFFSLRFILETRKSPNSYLNVHPTVYREAEILSRP